MEKKKVIKLKKTSDEEMIIKLQVQITSLELRIDRIVAALAKSKSVKGM